MKPLLAFVCVALLATPAFCTLGDNGMTTYNGRKRENDTLVFGNQLVVDQAIESTLAFTADVLKGTWRPTPNPPATEKKEVELECLNSVAPEPLNWKMWCPGKDAKVMGWTDRSGAAHRSITLRPQKGMTSTMYQWWITMHVLGLLPPIVEFQGNKYYYYHLWHPLDHVEAAWTMGPAVPVLQKGPPIYTLIHERYRNPASANTTRHYETNGWFYVHDSLVNLMKNRYVLTVPFAGMPTWTMILEFNDTPEGLVVDCEVVAGIPAKGFDERAPAEGYKLAAGMNEMFTAPLVARQRASPDWEDSINAITRHVIEEFSNLQHFVPTLYEKYILLGKAGITWIPTLGTFLQNNKLQPNDQSISFYHALVAMANKQTKSGNATAGLLDAAHNNTRAIYRKATDLATAAVVTKSQVYVPASNALTAWAFKTNAANGAHPERDASVSVPLLKRMFGRAAEAPAAAPAGNATGVSVSKTIHVTVGSG